MNFRFFTPAILSIILLMFMQPNEVKGLPHPKVVFPDSIPTSKEIRQFQHTTEKDTIKALENLFKRKRRFGFIKTIVFGSAAIYAVNHTLHPSEANSTNKSWQKNVEEDATIFTICAGTMLTVNGTLQLFRYSESTLKAIVEDRYRGIHFPKELIKKLKSSDFR